MKGCLKIPAPIPTPGLCSHRKCVAFCAPGSLTPDEVSKEFFTADEWDRTPTEPSLKLSYQDILELKEIQRSLPRANQLPDPYARRQGSHYLSRVPVGLLPLYDSPPSSGTLTPTTTPSDSPSNTPKTVSSPVPSHTPPPINASSPIKPSSTPLTPPSWNAARPTPVRPRPTFSFLPLLETPPAPVNPPCPDSDAEDHDPPTPALTNASSGGSPISRASSTSPEPSFLSLPIRRLDSQASSAAPGSSGNSSIPNTYLVGGRDYTAELKTTEVDESYFPPYNPSTTPKPRSPTSPTSTPTTTFEDLGFILNGDVDGDYDSVRRNMHYSPPPPAHTAPRPPSNRFSQLPPGRHSHSFSQPKINQCPSWAKCAPPPASTGVLFKQRSWGSQSSNQIAVKPVSNGRNVPWSG